MGVSLFGSIVDGISRGMEKTQHPGKSCDLALPIGDTHITVCDNGSLVSVIEIRGNRTFIGAELHEENIRELEDTLAQYFNAKAHDIGFFYEQDTDKGVIKRELEYIYSPIRSASRAQGLLNDELLNEEMTMLQDFLHIERTWLVCWTLPSVRTQVARGELLAGDAFRKLHTRTRQSLTKMSDFSMRASTHNSMLERLQAAMTHLGFSLRRLNNSEFTRNIRRCIDEHKTGNNWSPRLAGTNTGNIIYPAENQKEMVKEAAAALMPERIGTQLWPSEPEYHPDFKDMLIVGNRVYKILALRVMPNGRIPFNKLLREANGYKIPFRFSALLHSAGAGQITAKYALMSLLTIIPIPSTNKQVRDQIDALGKLKKEHGFPDAAGQYCLTTWAPLGEEDRLRQNADRLLQIVNGWGQANGYFLRDDVKEGFMSTLPGYRNGSIAPTGVGPLRELLYQMPLTRPSLPFDKGAMTFLSEDGRPLAFQPFDYKVMRHHVYLVVGEPGYGKSATINNMISSLVMSSPDVPYIGISDIGTSSLGSIRLAQSILPEGKKHLAMYHRFNNVERDAYNILQTDYALRRPLIEHNADISNLLELMLSDDRTQSIHPDLPGLIQAVLKLAYDLKADKGPKSSPNYYTGSAHNDRYWPEIGSALQRIGLRPEKTDTWWYIFDELHDAGEHRAASLVQRFAAPTLPFLARVASRSEIREEYPGDYDTSTKLVEYFARRIGEVSERYPALSNISQLDLGDARIIALDMEEVVPAGDKKSDFSLKKQGAIFVTVAARILTSRFFWKEDRLAYIPERYRAYYSDWIRSIRQTTNVFMEDEVQRTAGIPQADSMRTKITNEGRKWEIGIILSSQDVTEMPQRVIKFSTCRIICGFTKKSIDDAAKSLELTDNERELVIRRIRPPSKEGAWILLMMDADEGYYSQLVNVKMGPQKLWGLSTKNRDSRVRDAIYQEFGDEPGRRLLAKMYPSGSIEDEYQTRLHRLSESEDMGLMTLEETQDNKNVLEGLKDSIIEHGRAIYTQEIREGL
ncbi:hypothetical protein [Marinobacterium stanieri]|uniref:Intracellular multiplication protein IcmB n=1 Tax=Marinobacterium stanieri TaxID=49186 RepID=A0A1N6XB54_9GAMM|nr:hypothetical protein [Marinobacterium stanieri]SIQ99490.1 hypothetical protein SAMN05421647_11357 [Marinobacterium stanieri]